jgi:hypothetical protein
MARDIIVSWIAVAKATDGDLISASDEVSQDAKE